jgi:hypothetical protein
MASLRCSHSTPSRSIGLMVMAWTPREARRCVAEGGGGKEEPALDRGYGRAPYAPHATLQSKRAARRGRDEFQAASPGEDYLDGVGVGPCGIPTTIQPVVGVHATFQSTGRSFTIGGNGGCGAGKPASM